MKLNKALNTAILAAGTVAVALPAFAEDTSITDLTTAVTTLQTIQGGLITLAVAGTIVTAIIIKFWKFAKK
ncbi:MAG TPA: hypothetical protein V6C97_26435 [Oculatellaceae cyanobacterium]